jgi:hypothetical protein
MVLDPDAERWELPLVGFRVSDIWFSGQLYVIAYDDRSGWTFADFPKGAPRTQVAFGGAFVFTSSQKVDVHLDAAQPWETLVPVLALRGVRITSAIADRQAALEIVFDDGSSLRAGPDDHYENWEIAGPDALNLVSPPGGGDPRIAG